jgi:fibronectin-binding autotransporter adhesin
MTGTANSSRNRTILLAATAAVAGLYAARAWGQTVYDYSSGTYTQNFSSLSGTSNNPGNSGGTVDVANSAYGSGGAAMDGWYYYAQSKNVYLVDTNGQTGSASTGGLYAYGNGSVQAMGLQTTSATGEEIMALELVNTSASTLNSFSISFTDAVYHYGNSAGASKSLNFDYGVATSSSSSVPLTSLTTTGLNFTGTNPTPDTFTSAGNYQNGTPSALETNTFYNVNWGVNDALWLEWIVPTNTAQSPGIGISNLSFSASTATNPSVTWHSGAGTWDTSTANWTGSSTTYADGDTVIFANSLTSNSVVTVQGGGVAPAGVTINNTTGYKYTFAGGSINGGGSLTNTAGTTELSVANGYSGGTNINGGTVIADGDATLGSATGGISFAGGTLQAGAAIGSTGTPSQRGITVNGGGGTFNTNGFNSVTSGSATISDVFNVTGAGSLEIEGAFSFTTLTTGALNISSGTTVTVGSSGTINQFNNSNYDGKLIIAGTPRLNTDAGAVISSAHNTGEIDIANGGTLQQSPINTATPDVTYTTYNTGVYLTNTSGDPGGTIDVPIKLNSNNQTFTAADVTQSNANFLTGASATNNFTVTIGGTKGGGITIDGVISGNSDVNLANAPAGGGKGSLVLGAANTYTGTTLMNSNGTVTLAVPYAIPTTSDVIFGTINGAEGATTAIDLDGNVEQFNSLSSGQFGVAADENITNNSSNPATLVISGSTTPANSFQGSLNDGVGGLSLVKGGSSTLALSGTSSYSGGTTISGGTLQTATPLTPPVGSFTPLGLGTVTVNSPAILDLDGNSPMIGNLAGSGTVDNVSAGGTPTLTLSPSGSSNYPGIIKNTTGSVAVDVYGTGTQGLSGSNTYTGGTTVSAGTLVINPTSTPATTSALPNGGSVSISNGLLQLAPGVSGGSGPAPVSSVNISSLTISGSSAFDLNNNHIIITYGSSDPISTIAGYLDAGYNGGNWNGPGGIDTSAPLTVNGLKYGLGYADGKDGKVVGLTSGQIEVAYTLLGDANLDGFVNGEDFTILASNFNQSVTGWDQGDFNYDGTVNGEDFTLLAANFNQGVGSNADVSSGDIAALDAFAAANGITLPTTTSSVPEPATTGLLAAGGVGLLARRRRRNRQCQ